MNRHDEQPSFDPLDDPDMEEMKEVAATKGKAGDLKAIELSWRLRERALGTIDLAPIDDLAGVQKAQRQVIALLNARRITPRVAMTYARLIEYRRRAIRTIDLEDRIRAIEEEDDDEPPPTGSRDLKR